MRTIPMHDRTYRPKAVCWHHSGGKKDTPAIIWDWHKHVESQINQAQPGYNGIVSIKARFSLGRDLKYRPAHCTAHNEDTVGLCLCGNYNLKAPTQKQLETMARVTSLYCFMYNIDPLEEVKLYGGDTVLGVFSHRDVRNTDCPGDAFHAAMPQLRRRTAVLLRDRVLKGRAGLKIRTPFGKPSFFEYTKKMKDAI